MFCAISGEPPAQPVISTKSGQLYEARLIRKYIDENGKDPITGEVLSHDDLIEVKASPRAAAPRPPTHSSIPSLLTSLQNEYDGLMMELFTLKKNYDEVRMELAHALYANDAANRVVARLISERDEARSALASISGSLGASAGAGVGTDASNQGGDVEMSDGATTKGGLPPAAAQVITSTAQTLSSQRRAKMKRKAPAGYASAADVREFKTTASLPSMHSTKPPGVTSLDVSSSGNLLLTGGADKQVQVYDRASGRQIATLKGHTKKITRVVFSKPPLDAGIADVGTEAGEAPPPSFAVSASEDKSIRVWKLGASEGDPAPEYALSHVIKGYKAEVTGLDIHPSGALIGTCSKDGLWALHDPTTGERLLAVDAPSNETPEEAAGGYEYESFAFHPDGQLAATGTAGGVVRIWDVSAIQKVSTFRDHSASAGVTALGFSENGYYLAAGGKGSGEVKIWDLRKLSVAGTIDASESSKGEAGSVLALAFDPTASFLAVVGTDAKIYANKTWQLLAADDGNTAECTDCAWDPRDGSLVVSSLDRTVRILSKA
ncbi:putative PRP19-non-snRNP spliceosome component required for DNA [Ceraceosorus guamensis]|uniref:Pre-mRNA-processing factor 19 n=1 Tax=Ceraceosorus guamensis TaxID=1522189 RepID=A0A316W428_9BASI|nr:putative PRP19-non-snRNP spliceosome component required for DNA [Ceraceosorus guamensis]PWN44479.1 putative PRP19-non-snRNP spliceosome component required for DNA [Ceraceosorus guamensis]